MRSIAATIPNLRHPTGRTLRSVLAALCASVALAACASPPDTAALRVGTSGDYQPFSWAPGGWKTGATRLEGFDIALARAYAADRGRRIEWVRFRWPDLLADLEANRFDVAMSGVTVRPERSLAGSFSVPVAASGAVVLVREPERWPAVDTLDRAGARIAVNAGGHLERVTRARFPRAEVRAIGDNTAVLGALLDGRADAVVTDTREAPGWLARSAHLAQRGPFTFDRKAALVHPGRRDLAEDLDAWLMARERDGWLGRLRLESLGEAGPPSATPLPALLAAIVERLSLMPLVAESKRGRGLAVEAPAREQHVIRAALEATRGAAARLGRRSPPDERVRAVFRAQIEAAKAIQRAALSRPAQPDAVSFDLEDELRPALLRIGDRIARLIVHLPGEATSAEVRRDALRVFARSGLALPSAIALADSLGALAGDAGDQ